MMMISPRAGPVAYKHLYLMPPPEPEMAWCGYASRPSVL